AKGHSSIPVRICSHLPISRHHLRKSGSAVRPARPGRWRIAACVFRRRCLRTRHRRGPELTAAPSSTTLVPNLGRREGARLSEIPEDHATTACATARTAMFPFPSSDGKGGVTVGIVEDCPPISGSFFAFEGPVLTVHLGRQTPIRQRREDVS